MLYFAAIRHLWPEKAGFRLHREQGIGEYVFVHFLNEVEILVDGSFVTAPPHSCILYAPNTPQYLFSRETLIHNWFHFSGNPTPILQSAGLCPNSLIIPVRDDFITDIIQEMENEFFLKKKGFKSLLTAKFTELMLKLSRAADGDYSQTVDESTAERLRKLRSEVFLSLNHSWTVEQMAARVGLSQSRFHSVYRSMYGKSPMEDLIRGRIDSAKNALMFTTQPVSFIAESLGYNNVSHFIRQFRTVTGTSPLRYRKGRNED